MGGFVTSTRNWPTPLRRFNSVNGVPEDPETRVSGFYGTAEQTTTSYRTGGAAQGVEEDEDKELLSSKIAQDVRKALYSQTKRSRSSPFDNGHPFSTELKTLLVPEVAYTKYIGWDRYSYEGPVTFRTMSNTPVQGWPAVLGFDPDYYGTKAIAESAPTRPTLSLVTALIELKREGLPGLPGATILRDKNPQAFGSEFLNGEFGYRPLADDIAKAAYAIVESNRLIEQYKRDSGRVVRRSYTFDVPPVSTESTFSGKVSTHSNTTATKPWTELGSARDYGFGEIVDRTVHSRTVWFKGAYRYFVPVADSAMGTLSSIASKADNLLGLKLTPEVLYNLAPWTWLADWEYNLGDVVKNITNFQTDSLVLRYGYLMCTTQSHRTITHTLDPSWSSAPGVPRSFTLSYTRVTKERVKAHPYGFAQNPSSYTSRMWAILGALGLSRSPNTLP